MEQLRILSVVCAFSLSIAQVNAEDQFLVDDGKAYAEIIISESPTRLAAAELQTYVAKISGAWLPIRAEPSTDVPVQIYVGESPHAAELGVTADRLREFRILLSNRVLPVVHPCCSRSQSLPLTVQSSHFNPGTFPKSTAFRVRTVESIRQGNCRDS